MNAGREFQAKKELAFKDGMFSCEGNDVISNIRLKFKKCTIT
jgi:hypothetical protein